MNAADKKILGQLRGISEKRLPEMLSFVKGLSAISSDSKDRKGVNDAGSFFIAAMPKALKHEVHSHEKYGNCHYFENRIEGVAPFALMGHLDTVIPEGFNTFTEIDGKLVGPGVADMKGGLTVLLWTLRILEEAGLLESVPVRCLINSDEEINSPWSRELVPKLRGSQAGFVFELGGQQNNVVVRRIGITVARLKVKGIASHAGTGKPPKSSGILELATRVQQLEAMNTDDFWVNVGTVSGGRAYNYVPDVAESLFAIRYWDPAAETEFTQKLGDLLSTPVIEGCTTQFEIVSKRPPLMSTPETEALYEFCASVAKEVGPPLAPENRPGGSDASFLQQEGIPTLDGWGPIGDLDFSVNEYIQIQSMAERSALLASCLWLLSRKT